MSDALERDESLRLIRDSAAAVAQPGDLRRVRALRFTRPGFDPATWRSICDMGWPGLRVPEAAGGAGLGMAEFCALAEELGGALLPEPLLPVALAARLAPARALDPASLVLPAWQERAGAAEPGGATVLHGGRLTGTKLFVPMADAATAFVVLMPDCAALVRRDSPGLSVDLADTQDGGHFGTLRLDGAPAEALAADALLIADALDEASLATAASLLGVMQRAFTMTLDYLRTRRQFGRPIGAFQALQHRAVDLQMQIALTRASIFAAAADLDAGAPAPRRRAAVSRAKARASEAAMLVTRQAIQLHGGIGYTDEADIGLYLRRAMVQANQHGTAATHRARYARLLPPEQDE